MKGELIGKGKDVWAYLKHSRHYHDYFEGYAERKVPGQGTRIERVYVGDYFKQDVTDRVWVLLRICYAPLYLLGAGLFIYSGARQTEGNMAYYVSVSFFLSLVVILWIAVVLFSWFSAPRKMTRWEYHSGSLRLRGAAFVAAITLAVNTAVTGIFILLNRGCNLKENLISMLGFFIAALLMFTLYRIEKKVPYQKIPNETVRDNTSFVIEA